MAKATGNGKRTRSFGGCATVRTISGKYSAALLIVATIVPGSQSQMR